MSGQSPRADEAPRQSIVDFRPGWPATLLAYRWWLILGLLLLMVGWLTHARAPAWERTGHGLALAGAVVTTLALLAGFWVRISRRYRIDDEHATSIVGVISRSESRVPLRSIQHASSNADAIERALGVGHVGVWTGAGSVPALAFRFVEHPRRVLGAVAPASVRFVVIGLVGSIGAGKSEAARVLAEAGCDVIDADSLAKAALQTQPVKARLREWWGEGVLAPDGSVDRAVISRIVFADPTQRTRLESVVHPIVLSEREQRIAAARTAGRPGLVIDAPLLFEAKSDAICDAILCIDAPREVRLERVMRTRGWTDEELARREAAQLTIDEKRRRSTHTIMNDSSKAALASEVRAFLDRARRARA